MNPILRRVREVLEDTGKNQLELAAQGIASQQTLSRIKQVDDTEPSASTLASICEKLGVNGHWLLTGDGEKRVVSGGGDTPFESGIQAGLLRGEAALRALRTTSAGGPEGARIARVAEIAEELYTAAQEARAAASQPPTRRRRRSTGE